MVLNLTQDVFCVCQYSFIRETENGKALRDYVTIARSVVVPDIILFMDITIAFDDQARLSAEEVRDVFTELMLPAKFEARLSTA